MKNNEEVIGQTTIDPDVILTIIRMAALGVSGVCRMASGSAGIDDLVNKYYHEGVKIEVEDHTVYANVFLVLYRDAEIRKTAKLVQKEVKRAIEELVGMSAGRIDVHIEDIELRNKEVKA